MFERPQLGPGDEEDRRQVETRSHALSPSLAGTGSLEAGGSVCPGCGFLLCGGSRGVVAPCV